VHKLWPTRIGKDRKGMRTVSYIRLNGSNVKQFLLLQSERQYIICQCSLRKGHGSITYHDSMAWKGGEKPVLETKNLPSPPELDVFRDSLEGPPVCLGPRARSGLPRSKSQPRVGISKRACTFLTSARIMTQYSINGFCSLLLFNSNSGC